MHNKEAPPRKKLRRMGEKMPLKQCEKPLTQDTYPLTKGTSVNLETLKKQLDSLRTRIQLKNLILPENKFMSVHATSNKNGSTSNTKINEVQRISTPLSNTKDNISSARTFKPQEVDDVIIIIEDVAQNKRTLPFIPLNSRNKNNEQSTSKDVESSDDDIIVLKDIDIPKLNPKDTKHRRPIVIDRNSVALQFIVELAATTDGVILSNDKYITLKGESLL